MSLRIPFSIKAGISGLLSAALISTIMFASTAALAQNEPRQPPPTRSSETLSDRVFRSINEISEWMNPAEPNVQPDYPRAKAGLDALNERYDSLNDFEKSTLLNFYTNYYLNTDNIAAALTTFERMLTIENLRLEMRQRAYMALGQLYAGEERFRESITALTGWRDISEAENETVFLLLANNHYNLEEFQVAIPFLLQHMDLLRTNGKVVPRNVYGLLNIMYLELEDYVSAEKVTKEMVTLFDDPSDWRNLAALYGMLDNESSRVETLVLTFSKGYMNSEAQFLTLAQALAGSDAPYKGALIMEKGFQDSIIEENADNFERLTQMYLMASEYERALAPARRAAELSESGDAYDYLGYIYSLLHDYENAAVSMKRAIQIGGLDNAALTQYTLARVLLEIEDFSGAAEAARRAQELGNNNARQLITYIESSRQRRANLDQRKADAIDFYRS